MIVNATQQTVVNAIETNKHLEGALLPVLHDIQNKIGHIPSEYVVDIADALNLSRAEVHGVITFYHSFKTTAQGKHVIEVCRAESCQAKDGRSIEAMIKTKLGVDYNQTTDDGAITLEAVYCLGNCGCSPTIKIDSQIYGRVTVDRVADLIDDLTAEPHS